jgi:dihydrofolate reductase
MGQVVLDITMSLDGFVTAPGDGPAAGLGENGEVLHYWVFGGPWTYEHEREMRPTGVDKEALEGATTGGAAIVGRRMYDIVDGWGGRTPFGVPCLVVTHRTGDAPDPSSGFEFLPSLDAALVRGREIAGDKDIGIGGGASIAQQALRAGAVDRLNLHIAPVIFGGGRPLFGDLGTRLHLEPIRERQSPYATHLSYRVLC